MLSGSTFTASTRICYTFSGAVGDYQTIPACPIVGACPAGDSCLTIPANSALATQAVIPVGGGAGGGPFPLTVAIDQSTTSNEPGLTFGSPNSATLNIHSYGPATVSISATGPASKISSVSCISLKNLFADIALCSRCHRPVLDYTHWRPCWPRWGERHTDSQGQCCARHRLR